jgi:superfamily II DNA or RNA helicase
MQIIEEIKRIGGLREHQDEIISDLKKQNRGIIVSPTGSGKTICIMEDTKRFLSPQNVILVVSPRLLLSQQLMIEFDNYLHDYEFHHREISSQSQRFNRIGKKVKIQSEYPTTKPDDIVETYEKSKKQNLPLILFSTYDSLRSVIDSDIPINVAYFDEAHNSTKSNFFSDVKEISKKAKNCFFFTATPRYSRSGTKNGPGMHNESVYGKIITQVSYKYLVDKGYIVPPYLHHQQSTSCIKDCYSEQVDFQTIKENVEYYETHFQDAQAHKILYCMRGTKNIKDLISKTNFQQWASEKGYHVLSVDSKNGGYFDGKYMRKEKFMDLLKTLGEDTNTKLLVLHYEMISEGIDIKQFTGVCFMRSNANDIFITQTIGRCTRSSGPWKKYGVVTVVQHADDTEESFAMIKLIINSLLEHGVPLEYIYTETSGRGESEEVIDGTNNNLEHMKKDVEIEWIHSTFLEDYLQKSLEDNLLSLAA